ncbi:MAG: deoxyribonuclease IV [Candidatus Dormibacteraceae bacterium]
MPILGAHVTARGGIQHAFERAQAIGAAAIQVHPTPPQQWGSPKLDEQQIETFRELANAAGNPPFYFHAIYLINLASSDPGLRQRSESTLAGYLELADRLQISGVVFHTGSHKGAGFDPCLPTITEHLKRVMERANPTHTRLLIENNAGTGGSVGARFEELAAMLEAVDDPRLGSCFDSCHAFASGYDLRSKMSVTETLDEWERVVGLPSLEVIHCNDSMTGLGSNRDRHANIGQGEIGLEGFRALLQDSRLANTPFVLEVPGMEKKGPDAANLEILKSLIST